MLSASAFFGGSTPAFAGTPPPSIHHVWFIQLENESASTTFGAGSPATYLNGTLLPEGVFLPNYYGTGHVSLDNYLAEISGQPGNAISDTDCQPYANFQGTVGSNGVATGAGCVYPASVLTMPDQLTASNLTWRGYMEDMGNTPTRETNPCGQPTSTVGGQHTTSPADPAALPPTQDDTQSATAGDQYAARHNPFVYFHSLIDAPAGQTASACQANVVPLGGPDSSNGLAADLSSGHVANFNWITPNLCDDGHDGGGTGTCAGPDVSGATPGPGGLVSADRFLSIWVQKIMSSAPYQADGMIIVTFDEAADSDTSSCCMQTGIPGVQPAGGGGRVGALLLSPLLTHHTSTCAYNHFAMLRSLEDLYGIKSGGADGAGHLADAGTAGVPSFGADVYGPSDTCSSTPELPEMSYPGLSVGAVVIFVGAGLYWTRRRPRVA